jgi:hypothetical protein
MTAIHDFDGAQTYSEKPGHRFVLNADFASARELPWSRNLQRNHPPALKFSCPYSCSSHDKDE